MEQKARLLRERQIGHTDDDGVSPGRSITVNVTESPLGWLLAHGHVTRRQFEAGERLRSDWERAELAPQVTMAWDAAPVARGRGGSACGLDVNGAQIDAKHRFDLSRPSFAPWIERETAMLAKEPA